MKRENKAQSVAVILLSVFLIVSCSSTRNSIETVVVEPVSENIQTVVAETLPEEPAVPIEVPTVAPKTEEPEVP